MDTREAGARPSAMGAGQSMAGAERRMAADDRHQVAGRALERAKAALGRLHSGPGELARACGFGLKTGPLEASNGRTVLYRWTDDRSERRARVAIALAHGLLIREHWMYADADADLLASLLLA